MPSTISAGTTAGTAIAIAGDTTGNLAFQTNGTTTAMTINTSQGVSVLNCLGVGNATPSTSGAGITFPATQSASTDANTLDDYEEGTWTPSYSASGATFTYGVERAGWYVKIGRLVVCGFTLHTTARSGGSGTITITGLPFTSTSTTSQFGSGSVGTVNQWAHSGSYVQWGLRVQNTTTSISIFEFGQAGAQASDNPAQFSIIPTGTTTNSTLSVTYYID